MSQMCMFHWNDLREGIDAAGLGVLVAESSLEVATKVRRQHEEGLTVDTFEPLLAANIWITVEAARWGIRTGCPVCALPARNLVEQGVEKALEQWRGLKL